MEVVHTNSQIIGDQVMTKSSQKFHLSQRFYFESAHTLERTIEKEGSRRIHGHTYEAEVTLHGAPNPINGMIIDLAYLKKEIKKIRNKLDHHFLDEIPELGPATLENLCVYIYNNLEKKIKNVHSVAIERKASGDKCVLFNNN